MDSIVDGTRITNQWPNLKTWYEYWVDMGIKVGDIYVFNVGPNFASFDVEVVSFDGEFVGIITLPGEIHTSMVHRAPLSEFHKICKPKEHNVVRDILEHYAS